MTTWTITITRTGEGISRWSWVIREEGRLPPESDFCGYTMTRKRAESKAEEAIRKILHARAHPPASRNPGSYLYVYTPDGHGEETAS